jgi:hypothetical protein
MTYICARSIIIITLLQQGMRGDIVTAHAQSGAMGVRNPSPLFFQFSQKGRPPKTLVQFKHLGPWDLTAWDMTAWDIEHR